MAFFAQAPKSRPQETHGMVSLILLLMTSTASSFAEASAKALSEFCGGNYNTFLKLAGAANNAFLAGTAGREYFNGGFDAVMQEVYKEAGKRLLEHLAGTAARSLGRNVARRSQALG
jgi:hypothetical protein